MRSACIGLRSLEIMQITDYNCVQAKEAASLLPVTLDVVQEINNLAQLESIIDASGSSIVAVALYTRVSNLQATLMPHP